jgi:hypothetical protein
VRDNENRVALNGAMQSVSDILAFVIMVRDIKRQRIAVPHDCQFNFHAVISVLSEIARFIVFSGIYGEKAPVMGHPNPFL